MFCPNCGTKNEENSVFCANCGMKMKASQQQGENAEGSFNTMQPPNTGLNNNGMAYSDNTMPNVNNNITYPSSNMMNGIGYPNNMEPKKKSKTMPIVISIIAVLIIIVGIIVAVLLLSSDDKKGEADTTKDNKTIEKETTTQEDTTQENTSEEATTEEDTTEEATKEPEINDVTGTLVGVDNISFIIPASFEKSDTLDGNYIRYDDEDNPLESIYYYVQTTSIYSEEQMREAYKMNIEGTYGDDYVLTTYYVGDLEFEHYSFETGTLVEEYYSEVYVYSDGTNTLYFESLILEGEEDSSTDILDTVNINE